MDPESQTQVSISTNLRRYKIHEKPMQRLLLEALRGLGLGKWTLSVEFVSAQKIRELNAHYRSIDKKTDVLSFPQESWPKPLKFSPLKVTASQKSHTKEPLLLLGDIIICLDVAGSQAASLGHSLSREVAFLLIHGLLHLCGHDHENPKDEIRMLKEQRLLMQNILKHKTLNLLSVAFSKHNTTSSTHKTLNLLSLTKEKLQ